MISARALCTLTWVAYDNAAMSHVALQSVFIYK
jgi:hypothetical protein